MFFVLQFLVIKTLDPDPNPYPDQYPDTDSLEMLDPDLKHWLQGPGSTPYLDM